jgi:hypothetical protein
LGEETLIEGAITIYNLKHHKPAQGYDFKVDRSTPLGNPFFIHVARTRDQACDMYEKNFEEMIKDPKVKTYLDLLILQYRIYHQLGLFCWCVPERCHARTIARYIQKVVEER